MWTHECVMLHVTLTLPFKFPCPYCGEIPR